MSRKRLKVFPQDDNAKVLANSSFFLSETQPAPGTKGRKWFILVTIRDDDTAVVAVEEDDSAF